MTSLEYRLASLVLRVLVVFVRLLPVRRRRVVLATARLPVLEGNLLHLHDAIRTIRPDLDVVLLLQPYSYDLAGKLRYLARLVRGVYLVHTSRLVVVDNAYLPVHVAPHRPATTVVQVWHAPGALKRFGADTAGGLEEPERTFLHRYYDYVVAPGEAGRASRGRGRCGRRSSGCCPWGRRAQTACTTRPRSTRRARGCSRSTRRSASRRVVLYAPTFRGRGRAKHGTAALDGVRLRERLPADVALVLKAHPNLDPTTQPTAGFDVVADPKSDMNDWLALADVFVTDYSSSIFEWAILHRPLVLVVDDLEAYERDPGLYLDYRRDMIGTQVTDADGVADAILGDAFDLSGYDAFIAATIDACDGHASERFVDRFLPRHERG